MRLRGLICSCLSIWLAQGWSVAIAEQTLTRAQAESQLTKLRTEINGLKKTLDQNRKTFLEEQELLRSADLKIQTNALESRKLNSSRQAHEKTLASLHQERKEYLDSLEQRREVLAIQIMAAYQLGRESRLKLVLNQDSPALLSRMLAYYDYFNRSQKKQIRELRQVLETLDQMKANINMELSRLVEVQKRLLNVQKDIQTQREERQAIIDLLSSRIGSDETRLEELLNDRSALEELLENLSNVLADIPADLGRRLGPSELKGKLPVPVTGRVRHAFGQPRSEGIRWQGWLIGTESGREVSTIAYGRVAYSDWLRGYGLLMIIDHGDGFMSLYANNESLLHDVGDWVEAGSVISTVGASIGNGPGLYFEIRKNGKALDPAVWIHR